MIYAIYDLEIIKAIPGKEEKIEGIEYCEGWHDFENMGISVGAICTLDSATGVISDPIALTNRSDLTSVLSGLKIPLGGFNSYAFDDNLLAANDISAESSFDILEMILESAGVKGEKYWKYDPPYSYSLKKIVEENGARKTLSGELAPILWQQGRRSEVIEYCKNDVLIEAKMLKLLLEGELIDPNTKSKLKYG